MTDAKKLHEATLEDGFQRGDETIRKVTLRKPSAGELRGLALQDLVRSDVGSILTLLPRISDPIMTEADANSLSPADLAECAGIVAGFFMTADQRAMLERLTSTS